MPSPHANHLVNDRSHTLCVVSTSVSKHFDVHGLLIFQIGHSLLCLLQERSSFTKDPITEWGCENSHLKIRNHTHRRRRHAPSPPNFASYVNSVGVLILTPSLRLNLVWPLRTGCAWFRFWNPEFWPYPCLTHRGTDPRGAGATGQLRTSRCLLFSEQS